MQFSGSTAASILLAATALPVAHSQSQMQGQSPLQTTALQAYHLTAAPLARTLLRIAGDAHLALAYDPALVDGLQAAAVDGRFSAVDALRRALAGTGLVLEMRDNGRALALRKVAAEPDITAPQIVPQAHGAVASQVPAAPVEKIAVVNIKGNRGVHNDDDDENHHDDDNAVANAPGAIFRIDCEQLERQQITSLLELQQLVPALSIQSTDPSDTRISIRGMGDGGGQAGGESNIGMPGSVAVYLNNVYLARPGMLATDLDDLDYAQVLSGAQGTLFGANATGGVVDLHSRAPGFTPEGSVSIAVGQDGYLRSKVMLSGPLGEQLAGRLNVLRSDTGGDVRNLHNGDRLDASAATGLRGQLLYRPDARFSLRLSADAANSNGTPTPVLVASHVIGASNLYLAHLALVGATAVGGADVEVDDENHMHILQGGLSAQADWLLDGGFRLRSVSSWRAFSYRPALADNLDVAIYANSGTAVLDRSWSQELRLTAPHGDIVDYAVGASYQGQNLATSAQMIYPDSALPGLYYANPIYRAIDVIRHGTLHDALISPFAEATWHLSPRVDLNGGLRLAYDDKGGQFVRLNKAPFDSGYLRQSGLLPSALLNLSMHFDRSTNAYLAWSSGEKAGGINVSAGAAGTAGSASLLVAPEKTGSVELGIKTLPGASGLTLKADLFETIVHGFQTQRYDPAMQQTYLMNAGSFRSRGAEASLLYARGQSSADLGIVFNDARYLDYAQAPCPPEVALAPNPPASCNLDGHRVFNTPPLTLNAGLQQGWNTAAGLELHAGMRYAWRGAMYATVDDSQWSRQGGYGLLSLSAGVGARAGGGHWDATLWLNNALDKRYYRRIESGDYGSVFGWLGAPRTLGIKLSYQY